MDMRCFIAVNLDESVKREVAAAIKGLAAGRWDVKWVAAHNLHITLKFLGNTPDDSVEKIKKLLETVASHHMPFTTPLQGVGVFPGEKKPRVIWIDILDSQGLINLQAELEDRFVTIGYKRETRTFSPHLTIGRIRSISAGDRVPFMMALGNLKDRDFGNIGVNRISFMKSDLKPTGAQYSIVAEFPLAKEEQ